MPTCVQKNDRLLSQEKEYVIGKKMPGGMFFLSGLTLMTMKEALQFKKAQMSPNDWRLVHLSEMPERERQLSSIGDISQPCAFYPTACV